MRPRSTEFVHALLGSALFLGLGLFVLAEAEGFSRRGAMLPLVVGYGMVGGALVLLAQAWLRRARPDDDERNDGSLPRRWALILTLVAWVGLMPYLGFIVSGTLGFLAAALIVPREERWTARAVVLHALVGLAASLAVYALFAGFLNVPLPKGRWW
ncbi:MAG: tripartite tricarboxylate transporter TctB family protein [Geminicoccaceae bacterium]|nr:MAG: tripartite tricarboxylate transporter TctB family protein [Geminicoccaceae bacterium]